MRVGGNGLSITTAGIATSFRILLRDECAPSYSPTAARPCMHIRLNVCTQGREPAIRYDNRISRGAGKDLLSRLVIYATFTPLPVVLSGRILNGSTATSLHLPYPDPTPRNILTNHSVSIGTTLARLHMCRTTIY